MIQYFCVFKFKLRTKQITNKSSCKNVYLLYQFMHNSGFLRNMGAAFKISISEKCVICQKFGLFIISWEMSATNQCQSAEIYLREEGWRCALKRGVEWGERPLHTVLHCLRTLKGTKLLEREAKAQWDAESTCVAQPACLSRTDANMPTYSTFNFLSYGLGSVK